jgi:hypothetical protein
MSRLACVFALFLLTAAGAEARHAHHPAAPPPAVLNVGGLQFQLPADWQSERPETAARAGQWLVPPPAGQTSDDVEVVVFFFGPKVGGSAQENIKGWAAAVTTPDGQAATAAPQTRTIAGHAFTEVLLAGTYAKPNPQPGLPPTPKPGYGLWGAVLENPAGTIYWRVTGPLAQVATLAPALEKMLDGLKPIPVPAPPAAPPSP